MQSTVNDSLIEKRDEQQRVRGCHLGHFSRRSWIRFPFPWSRRRRQGCRDNIISSKTLPMIHSSNRLDVFFCTLAIKCFIARLQSSDRLIQCHERKGQNTKRNHSVEYIISEMNRTANVASPATCGSITRGPACYPDRGGWYC